MKQDKIRIQDEAQLEKLLKEAYAGRKRVITNCFMFADKLNRYVRESRLFYEMHDDGLILLCDMDDYYILYYHIAPDKGIGFTAKDKPTVIEFFDFEYRHNQKNDVMIPYFEKAGFGRHNTIRRMSCEYDEASIRALENAHEDLYEVIVAREEHYDTILRMLYDTFDPLKNLFPARADMMESLRNGEFFCILGDAGEVICTVQAVYEKASFYMLYVVTDPAYRGKNLSWQIRKYATLKAWDMGIRKRVGWVLEGNTPGIVTAKKTGLAFDGAFTLHYIK
jgi:GNAT superfamily N-acetyltransferase